MNANKISFEKSNVNVQEKKRGYPASLSDLVNGKKIRFNKDYKGNDQLGAIEVISDSDSDSDKNSLLEKQKKK
jgi:hypothetical protein